MRKSSSALTTGVIWKQLLIFAIPILISNLFQQIYNMTDVIVVGNFVGPEAVAAVGSSSSLINMIVGFFLGLSAGAGVIIAQYYGAKDKENVEKTVHTAMMVSIISGFILMAIGIFLAPWFLSLMKTPAEIMGPATEYLQIYFCGIIGVIIYNLGSGILRGIGDSFKPLLFLIVTVLLNVVLDLWFVAGFGWGVAGVGWATTVAQILSAAMVLILLMRTDDVYKVKLNQIKLHRPQLARIFKVGLPTGLQSVIISFSNVIIQSSVNTFGATVVAGVVAASKVDGFVYMPMASFGIAITTFVGQNFGAKRLDRVKEGIKICMIMSVGSTILISLFVVGFDTSILRLFVNDAEVIKYGSYVIRIIAPTYFIFAITDALSGAIRGGGKAHIPMFITLAMLCGVRITWILLIAPLNWNLGMVHLCYPISWSLSTVALLWYHYKSKWLNTEG